MEQAQETSARTNRKEIGHHAQARRRCRASSARRATLLGTLEIGVLSRMRRWGDRIVVVHQLLLASLLQAVLIASAASDACAQQEQEGAPPLKFALTLPLDYDADKRHKPVYAVAFSPDSSLLTVGGDGSTVTLYQTPMGHVKMRLESVRHNVHSLMFLDDGKSLFSGSDLWDVATGRRTRLLDVRLIAQAVAISRDEKTLAAGRYRDDTTLWNLETKKQLAKFDPFAGAGRIDKGLYKPTTYHLEFTHDGSLLIATVDFFDDELPQIDLIQFWNLETGKLVKAFRGASARISPDSSTLAFYHDEQLRLLDLKTMEQKQAIASPRLNRLVWSPDGQRIAGKGYDKAIHLINLTHGKHVSQPAGHSKYIYCIEFSPDGKWLATGSGDGSVKLWAVRDVQGDEK